jgi:hypothetical protein
MTHTHSYAHACIFILHKKPCVAYSCGKKKLVYAWNMHAHMLGTLSCVQHSQLHLSCQICVGVVAYVLTKYCRVCTHKKNLRCIHRMHMHALIFINIYNVYTGCTCMHSCVYAYVCMCTRLKEGESTILSMHLCTHVYIHTYTHTHMHEDIILLADD